MQKFRNRISDSISTSLALAFTFFVLIVILINSLKISMSDFETYYYSSIMGFDERFKLLIFQPVELCNYVKNVLEIKGFYAGFTHPPNICFYYYPFTLMDVFNAKLLNNLISILLFIFSLKRLVLFYKIEAKYLVLLPIVFYFPFRSNIYFGQFYFILFFLLSESLLALENKKYTLSSLMLSLAIVTKVFPVFLILFLLITHPIKVALKVISFCTFFILISIAIQGTSIWKLYLLDVFPRTNFGEIHASFSYYFQTFFLFFKMMFVYDELRNPLAIYDSYSMFLISVIIVKSAILVFAVNATLRNKSHNLYNYGLWLLCSLLLLPNCNTYTMIFIIFALFFYLNKYQHHFILVAFVFIIVFYISWVPAYKMMHMNYLLRYSKLIFMMLLFVVLIKTEGVHWSNKLSLLTIGFVILTTFNLFFKERYSPSKYVIVENKPELISRLYLKNDLLYYAYWSPDGEIHCATEIKDTIKHASFVKLLNNQLYFNGKKITSTKDLKLSPVFVNNEIYYLSDFNQGYGFYTIRKIERISL